MTMHSDLPNARNDYKPSVGLLAQDPEKMAQKEGLRGSLSGISFTNVLFSVLEFLKPEFLQRRKAAPPPRKGNTAWLDGLRGCAAFSVLIMHLTVYTHRDLEVCYGKPLPDGTPNVGPAAWPGIRILFTGGHFAVMLFYVISGYVVPRRLMQLLHEGRKDEFVEAVNSAIFRRPGRLFLPVVWSTFFLAIFMGHLTYIDVPFPHYKSNIFHEAWTWFTDMMLFFYFHRQQLLFTWYNFHTWTIPVELRGSMFIFVWLFATHQMRTRPRVILTLIFTGYLAIFTPGAWYACFFAGMFTSELDLLAAEGWQVQLPWDNVRKWVNDRPRARMLILHAVLLSGLYLASQPSSDGTPRDQLLGECWGWGTLNWLIPTAYKDGPANNVNYRWYYLFWAAWLILVGVRDIPWARWFFETGPAQYLGRHSFSLYIVHGPMIGIFSERLFYLAGVKTSVDVPSLVKFGKYQNVWFDSDWFPFSANGPPGLEPNFLFCVALSLPVFMYTAELGTKAFDIPSVKVSSWMYKKAKSMT